MTTTLATALDALDDDAIVANAGAIRDAAASLERAANDLPSVGEPDQRAVAQVRQALRNLDAELDYLVRTTR